MSDANSDRDRGTTPSALRRADRRAARRAALERRQVERRGEVPEALDPTVELPREGPSLGELVEPLIDGIVVHAGKHLALVKYELVTGAQEASRDLVVAAVAGGAAAIGYVMLNVTVAIVIGALWGGLFGIAAGLGALALLHMAVGGLVLARSVRRLRRGRLVDLSLSREEIGKDAKWLKEIKEPKALPSPETEELEVR